MIDPDIAVWVAEFVLRQPNVEKWMVNEIIFALPLPSPLPSRLRRTILLYSLASDLSRGSPSLHTLHALDLLLDDRSSSSSFTSSESMAIAYRAVALHCVADALPASDDDGAFRAFVDGLCSRVAALERTETAILPAEPLRELRMEVEAAAGSRDVRATLSGRDTSKEALDAIKVYLKCATEELGTSFLELTADTVIRRGIDLDALDKSGEKDKDSGVARRVGERASGLSGVIVDHGVSGEAACLEMSREVSSPSRDTLDKYTVSEIARVQDEAAQHGKPSDKLDPLPTPECEKVANALKSSCAELHRVVVDPLQDAVMQADEVSKSRLVETTNDMEPLEIHITETRVHREPSSVEQQLDITETGVQTDGTVHAGIQGTGISNTDGVQKRSLMDRNPTAHTYEWGEESIESSSETSLTSSKKICLPSPERRKVSPLTIMENKKFVRRRKGKRWSLMEEDALRRAVEKHGRGNWKMILNCYPDIFEDRTEVDLKDKWRNMTRH